MGSKEQCNPPALNTPDAAAREAIRRRVAPENRDAAPELYFRNTIFGGKRRPALIGVVWYFAKPAFGGACARQTMVGTDRRYHSTNVGGNGARRWSVAIDISYIARRRTRRQTQVGSGRILLTPQILISLSDDFAAILVKWNTPDAPPVLFATAYGAKRTRRAPKANGSYISDISDFYLS